MTTSEHHTGSKEDRRELDPGLHPERWEQLVARINEAAAPVLEARRPISLLQMVTSWRRPLAWGSAGLVAAAAMSLLLVPTPTPSDADVTLTEAVMPWAVAAWMDGSYSPTVVELVQAVDAYTP